MESAINRSASGHGERVTSTGLNVAAAREILLEASSQCVTDAGSGVDERRMASDRLLRALKTLSVSHGAYRAPVGG